LKPIRHKTYSLSVVFCSVTTGRPIRYATDAYRAVLAVQLGNKIYILHSFQKKAKKGIATPKMDVDLIKQRYSEAKELAKHEQ
jgi:phage-related protein